MAGAAVVDDSRSPPCRQSSSRRRGGSVGIGGISSAGRQCYPNPAARLVTDDGDGAAVQFNRPAGDREAEASSAVARTAASESLENVRPLVGCDARSVVAHVEHEATP